MKFSLPNEGACSEPTFISRPVGDDRASDKLESLARGIVRFLEKPNPVSEYELSELFDLIAKGQIEIQNKKHKMVMAKIKKLKMMECAQRAKAKQK